MVNLNKQKIFFIIVGCCDQNASCLRHFIKQSSLNSMFCRCNIRIWIKIMQEDDQLKSDLKNALKKDYVFPLNPENMQRHINEV